MKKFVRDCLLFGLIQCVIAVAAVAFFPYQPNRYANAWKDKHRLLDKTPPPRLLLIGGSNVAFGYDSAMLKAALPLAPVNMGLHASFGLPFMLNEVKEKVRAGDVIVVSPEYVLFSMRPTTELMDFIFYSDPRAVKYFSDWSEWKALLDGSLGLFGGVVEASIGNVAHRIAQGTFIAPEPPYHDVPYNRGAFDEFGDATGHWNRKSTGFLAMLKYAPDARMDNKTIALLNAFNDTCTRRGAKVYYAFPPYMDEAYAMNKAAVDQTVKDIRAGLKFPILNRPEDMRWERQEFFDTENHLKREGVTRRTQMLIDALKPKGIGAGTPNK